VKTHITSFHGLSIPIYVHFDKSKNMIFVFVVAIIVGSCDSSQVRRKFQRLTDGEEVNGELLGSTSVAEETECLAECGKNAATGCNAARFRQVNGQCELMLAFGEPSTTIWSVQDPGWSTFVQVCSHTCVQSPSCVN